MNKISILGSGYQEELAREIPEASLPTLIGGRHTGYLRYTAFPFDRAYLCPGYRGGVEEDEVE